jgi:hypothetical protein
MESYKEDKRGGALATEYRSDATSNGSLGFLHQILAVLPDESRGGWEEEYAYSLGVQAYIWGFPWIYLYQLRWLWTTEGGKAIAKAKGLQIPWAPLNTFFHAPDLATPENASGGSPNCDTLYSIAWLDVGRQPMVLHVPAIKDRYYCMQLVCLDSDNFAYVGSYATGTAEGDYLIGGPGWQGRVPAGVLDFLPRSRTPAVLIFGRTGVNNNSQAELDIARSIQKQYRLTPLSDWPHEPREHPTHVEAPVGIDYNDTRGAWITMNRAMTENPPGVLPGINQTQLIDLFATIGVGPNQSIEKRSPATILGLQRAAKDGIALLKKMAIGRGNEVNNWLYPPRDLGQAGQNSDFITRAAVQALAGIADHYPDEAVYINTAQDSDGNQLTGDAEYLLTFDPKDPLGGFPPFDEKYHGFWSVTMYQQSDYNLVQGSKSYSINSYDPKYSLRQEDGSLTIRMQRDEPKPEKGVYWLQTPPPSVGAFYLILRVYVPGPEVSYTQNWIPPTIKRVR